MSETGFPPAPRNQGRKLSHAPISAGAVLGGLLTGGLLVAAILGQVATPYDPLALDFGARLAPPGPGHWLGTDELGRDILSRLMRGASASARIALLTTALAVAAGTLLGGLSGFFGGLFDRAAMTLNDAMLAFPGLLMALGLLAVFGADETGIILALALAYSSGVARIVRGAVLSLRERAFVEASTAMGNSRLYTLLRHVLPNCLGPIIVMATSMCGWVILSESALSFLGLGVAPPAPTWGNMLAGGRSYFSQAPWLGIFPGLAISLALLGVNLLGDALRDRFDPRRGGRA